MKIAMIIHKLNISGGVQRHVLSVAHELIKEGHNVKIYTFIFKPENCSPGLLPGLEIISLKNYSPLRKLSDSHKENRAAKELAFLIDKDTDVLNPHDQVCYKTAYYFKKKIKNTQSVWTMHDMPSKRWFFWRESQFRPLKLNILKKIIYRCIDKYNILPYLKAQDKILVLGERDRGWLKEYFGLDSKIIRNGLDAAVFPFFPRTSPERSVKILMSGIFSVHRRFEDGIAAVKILRNKGYDATVSIIGDTSADKEYFKKINDLISSLGLLEKVFILGRVEELNLLAAYKNHDIFIFPNHLQSWGLAVFEAMASGLPVVVSKGAGASEVLEDCKTAMLVPPLAPQAIASAVEILIQNQPFYGELSRSGRKFVEENVSWSRLAKDYEKYFHE